MREGYCGLFFLTSDIVVSRAHSSQSAKSQFGFSGMPGGVKLMVNCAQRGHRDARDSEGRAGLSTTGLCWQRCGVCAVTGPPSIPSPNGPHMEL